MRHTAEASPSKRHVVYPPKPVSTALAAGISDCSWTFPPFAGGYVSWRAGPREPVRRGKRPRANKRSRDDRGARRRMLNPGSDLTPFTPNPQSTRHEFWIFFETGSETTD